jgi:hypothetical protein
MVSEHASLETARDETRFNNRALMKCGLDQPMGAAMSEALKIYRDFEEALKIYALIGFGGQLARIFQA